MSKSLGNVVDPHLLVDNYGVDPVRYFLLRQIPFGVDGNFAHDDFLVRYNSDLANGIETCINDLLDCSKTHTEALFQKSESERKTISNSKKPLELVWLHSENIWIIFSFSMHLEALQVLIQEGNRYIQVEQPWKLIKIGEEERCGQVMRYALEVCRVAAWLVHPIMPNKCQELLSALSVTDLMPIPLANSMDLLLVSKRRWGAPLSQNEKVTTRHSSG